MGEGEKGLSEMVGDEPAGRQTSEFVGKYSIICELQRANLHLLISVSVSPCELGDGDICWVTGTKARRATTLSMLSYNVTVNHRHMETL